MVSHAKGLLSSHRHFAKSLYLLNNYQINIPFLAKQTIFLSGYDTYMPNSLLSLTSELHLHCAKSKSVLAPTLPYVDLHKVKDTLDCQQIFFQMYFQKAISFYFVEIKKITNRPATVITVPNILVYQLSYLSLLFPP